MFLIFLVQRPIHFFLFLSSFFSFFCWISSYFPCLIKNVRFSFLFYIECFFFLSFFLSFPDFFFNFFTLHLFLPFFHCILFFSFCLCISFFFFLFYLIFLSFFLYIFFLWQTFINLCSGVKTKMIPITSLNKIFWEFCRIILELLEW